MGLSIEWFRYTPHESVAMGTDIRSAEPEESLIRQVKYAEYYLT